MSQFTSEKVLAIGLRDEMISSNVHVAAPPYKSDVVTKTIRPQLSTASDSSGDASIKPIHCTRQKPVCPGPTWKRTLDVAGSLFALATLWPLLLGVAAFIRCVSRGPVLFRQRRYGRSGQPFNIWKFRTMEASHAPARHLEYHADLMNNGRPLKKIDYEFEIIPGGHWLRRYGVDELPQLFNVLRGEMS